MKFEIIRSGSKGNATLLFIGNKIFLIDMGICLKTLNETLNKYNLNLYDIDALFLTHSHSDHTSGVKLLPPLPIYCGEGVYDANNINIINAYEEIIIDNVKIIPLTTSHDASPSFGFMFYEGDDSLCYMTDTGYIPDKSLSFMANATYYIIESNHNLKKLYQTNRPILLKERIASDVGHLSNEDSAIYMSTLVGENTKQIFLAHLSEEANTPELALKAYEKKFKKYHIDLDKIEIYTTSQKESICGGNKNEL